MNTLRSLQAQVQTLKSRVPPDTPAANDIGLIEQMLTEIIGLIGRCVSEIRAICTRAGANLNFPDEIPVAQMEQDLLSQLPDTARVAVVVEVMKIDAYMPNATWMADMDTALRSCLEDNPEAVEQAKRLIIEYVNSFALEQRVDEEKQALG